MIVSFLISWQIGEWEELLFMSFILEHFCNSCGCFFVGFFPLYLGKADTTKKYQQSIICWFAFFFFFISKIVQCLQMEVVREWWFSQAVIHHWAGIMQSSLGHCGQFLIWAALGYAFMTLQHIVSCDFSDICNF